MTVVASNFERKEVIGNCTLYLADCLEVIPELTPVDCVVTDPPYLLESGGNTTSEMGGMFARGEYDNSGAIVQTPVDWPDFMPAISQAIDRGHVYVMANNRNIGNAKQEAEKAGMRFHNILAWNKRTATPNRWYMKNLEFIGFFFKGKTGIRQVVLPRTLEGIEMSWVIVSIETGAAVREISNPELLKILNTEKYEAVPALDYLHSLNEKSEKADANE